MPVGRDRAGTALLWSLAVITGLGPWLLPVAVVIARPGKPFPLDVFTQIELAPRALTAPLAAVHGVVYVAIFFLLAIGMALFARHGIAGSQQVILATLREAAVARQALRVAAISSSAAFLVAIVLMAGRWRAA